jgi:uncharacterized membrane protein (UPF0182 family)
MYIALLVLLLTGAGALVFRGYRRRRRSSIVLGSVLAAATLLFFALMSFLGELFWFEALGYERRFWTLVLTRAVLLVVGWGLGAGVTWALTLGMPRTAWVSRRWPEILGGFVGAAWLSSHWELVLRWLHGVDTGVAEPILGRDIGFYLFTLPLYDALFALLLALSVVSIVAWAVHLGAEWSGVYRTAASPFGRPPLDLSGVARPLAAAALVLGWGRWLATFHLLQSDWGAVNGAGWTDVHVRLPANYLAAAVSILAGLAFLLPAVRGWLTRRCERWGEWAGVAGAGVLAGAVAAVWLFGLLLVPGLIQLVVVEPNEISFERPYIAHNIELTRRAYGLADVESREFPAEDRLTQANLDANREVLAEVRLWDWRALNAVYEQFQEIRLYYEFEDPDIDRYRIDGRYRQVMVAAREMETANLPATSRTFVNRRFKYTHGHGLTLAPVSDFTAEGLPNLILKDIPPRSEVADLEVSQPAIYYGELTREHVFVNTTEAEFDYPSGDENAFAHYAGSGGVRLGNLWRKFLYAWKFDGTRFFLSAYPTAESRVLFHRQVRERVQTLAPFLRFDEDAYIVLVEGRLYWIIDGYTVSDSYPYSEPYDSREQIEFNEGDQKRRLVHRVHPELDGVNYLRNSVKAVVDAYEGTVSFYVFAPEDPLIRMWQSVFPRLFVPREQMPVGLLEHVRYPEDLLLAQGRVYAKYHMEDPEVFYNQEDLWVRATEKYYDEVQPVEPYYVMWRPPGSESPEFVLILPFTPKNRQVLIGWIAGMCDGANYGRFLAYKFPKERRVLGPQQVETKIDQDPVLSGQLSLWDQRGSRVIRGNVLAIPIDGTLMYVEPIYLQAETAAYPELRLVAIMHGDRLSYAPTFAEALARFGETATRVGSEGGEPPAGADLEEVVRLANEAFDAYLRLQGEGRFRAAAAELESLEGALRALAERTEPDS